MNPGESFQSVHELGKRGVQILAPEQVFIDADVDLARISAGAVLYPGTRLHGPRTFLSSGARVGTEGPAVLENAVLGEDATVASGYVSGAVLLRGARLGANSHVREGTILEEQASTGHAVGLKQTILLPFVTLGSLINFCDALVAGGTSRRDHSEVGSGFIHFNFTPWGAHGDKATPSLVGDVVHGVFLDQPRIFLGGSGGMVGPLQIGYGSITAAGQVVRRDVAAGLLVLEAAPAIEQPVRQPSQKHLRQVVDRNAAYLGELVALKAWYRHVRLAHSHASHERTVLTEAMTTLDGCIDERWSRLASMLKEHGVAADRPSLDVEAACPTELQAGGADHLSWVATLSQAQREEGRAWLQHLASTVSERIAALMP